MKMHHVNVLYLACYRMYREFPNSLSPQFDDVLFDVWVPCQHFMSSLRTIKEALIILIFEKIK